ncbi:MAG: hypothetical protein NVV59_00960 [Chitinophagaceae bacterium]|nr:hypothetical protein [Chitinophagaceae bacterium]
MDLHIDMPAQTGNLTIAPLLLLPLVENCFKHGNSRLIDQAWMNLKVELSGNQMQLKLMNGKPAECDRADKASGIGLENVRKRLELLYPGRHHLTIDDEGEVFILNLKLMLDESNNAMSPTTYYTA